MIRIVMKLQFAAAVLLACSAHAAAVRHGLRLRETALAPPKAAAGLGLIKHESIESPERVAGYFRLNRTYAAEMFYFYFQASSCCCRGCRQCLNVSSNGRQSAHSMLNATCSRGKTKAMTRSSYGSQVSSCSCGTTDAS